MSKEDREMVPIAVVGVSALFPGSADARGFWADILAGRDLVTDVPSTHWLVEDYYDPEPSALDKTYCKRGAFLSPVDFDPMEFGIPPSNMPSTDTSQILALIVAQKVLEDASQGQFAAMDRESISVVLGVTSGQQLLNSMVSRLQRPIWIKALRESGIPEAEAQAICDRITKNYVPWHESTFPGLLGNVVAGRIANRFDLRGTNAVTDAACASSMAAVSMGINELQLGQSDLVITGGVDTMNDIFMYMCFSKTPALSPTGDCRPFSDAADGTLLGEGLSMIALKRLADAERDGDRIYAVVRGIGASSDGRSKSVYAPLPEGQSRALRRAYESADYGPETVELLEAHGTGTKAGDAAEFEGLRATFAESGRTDTQWCALGSVKSQIGHTKAAAGAAGLFKAIMALHHKVLPPTIKVERPNPALEFEKSAFYLNTQARPWVRDQAHPRRASVSSFGFGGSNFHVALEEYVPAGKKGRPAWRLRSMPTELVLLSAPDAADLIRRCHEIEKPEDLVRLARRSQEQFCLTDECRLAIVAANKAELVDRLKQAADLITKSPNAAFVTPAGTSYATGRANPGGIAFLFPGQGSQYVGMGADVAMAFDEARAAWDRAAGVRFEGESINRVVFPPPAFTAEARAVQATRLTATEWAQVALGVHSVALMNVLHAVGVRPQCVAGHSFGEITALHAAGAFDETTLVKIARRRGELMRDASSASGAMTAVTCSISEVRSLLNGFGDSVVVANHNAPAQCVLSGDTKAIAQIEEALAGKGITARRLAVATAFHSPLVASSSAPFHEYLSQSDIGAPKIDVYGANAAVYPRDANTVRERLAAQIAEPVRFLEQIEAMYAQGVRTFIEVGAGGILTELVGRILGDREHRAVNLERKGSHGLTSLQIALGRLAVGGVPMDLGVLWAPYAPFSDKPVKKPAMAVPVSGVNFGKPYPPAGGVKDLPLPNPPREATPILQADLPAAPQHRAAEAAAAPADVHNAWLHAYQEAQRQTADAHAAYQRAMAESHMAFLKTAEASFAGLSALLSGEKHANAISVTPPVPVAAPMAVQITPPMVSTPMPAEPVGQMKVSPVAAPTSSTDGSLPAAALAPGAELEPLLLEVVSQKTGYPVEMLGAHMDMEADLGIDSIKRVEILSAMSERAPGLRDVKMTEFATLRTLEQIVEHMRLQIGGAANQSASGNGSAPKEVAPPMMDLEALLLEVVSQKTGYPAEMLGAHMDMESDLGIDSIKRVEILSAMSERRPELRDVKMTEFATLRTLGQIAEHMHALGNGASALKSGANGFTPSNGAASVSAVSVNGAASANGTVRKVSTTGVPAADVRRFAVRRVTTPAVGMALRGIFTADCVWITDDGAGLASLLAEEISRHGVTARVAAEIPYDANAVVFLGGLRAVESIDAAIAANREAFQIARTLAARFALVKSGIFVTVQDTGGDFGLRGHSNTRAWLGGVSALARTAALEWPHISVKAIDCELAGRDLKAAAQAICTELFEGGATLEAGLRADGTRITLGCVAETTRPEALPRLGPDSVVVASGGARGVTAAALIELARAHRPRIVLLGRTPFDAAMEAGTSSNGKISNGAPLNLAEARLAMQAEANAQKAREIRATLDALTAAGSFARYIEVDVQDGAAVSTALDSVRREWGAITAIVHGAGVLADKRIADKTDEQFDRVFDTKVNGLLALLDATANDPLNIICLFSSVAARTGNPGQCDYAMANEVLNLVACAERARRGETCTVRSIGWGPWDGGMVTPGLKTHFKQMGVNVIPLALGVKMFVDELNSVSTSNDVIVVIGASGQGPLGSNSSSAISVEVRVDRQSHPYLDDHRVAGVPVVPVVLALEWMVRAANVCRPDLIPVAVRNLRVLNGIKLDRFDRAGEILAVNCRQSGGDEHAEITVELRGCSGTLHYSAVVEMSERTPDSPQAPELPGLGPWTQSEIYDGHVLFHRERFQMIQSIEGISDEGIVGILAGTSDMDWPREAWCTDPALLDGGLQLAGLWTRQVLGGICLPMGLADFRIYRPGLVIGPVRCVVHARKVFDARAMCDVSFIDAEGSMIAEMRGVETVLRPEEVLSASAAGASRA